MGDAERGVEKKEEWVEKLKAIKEADEKAGRRIRGDKVDVLKKLHDKFNDVMDSIKDLIGFAEYDDMKPKEWFEKEEAGVKKEDVGKFIGYSCIGRFDKNKGCDWSLGGLLKIHEIEIISTDGEHCKHFDLA